MPPTVAAGSGSSIGDGCVGGDRRGAAGSSVAAGHDPVDLVDERFERRRAPVAGPFEVDGELGADAAGVRRQHEHAVGEQDRLFDVVGDDEHRPGREVVACPQREQLGAQVLGGEHVERGERFVHEQRVGFDDERAGEADALAHAAGELLGVGGLEAVEADEVDRALGAVAAFGCAATLRASRPSSTFWRTVSHGSSAKVWNTIATPGFAAATGCVLVERAAAWSGR